MERAQRQVLSQRKGDTSVRTRARHKGYARRRAQGARARARRKGYARREDARATQA
jgi:hypothetical protein